MKESAKLLSVIIPVRNEEGNLEQLHAELQTALAGHPYELLYVVNGSTDESHALLRTLKEAKILTIPPSKKITKARALQEGFDHAQGNILITIDGDLQNDPADIPLLLTALKDCNAVIGRRQKRHATFFMKNVSFIGNLLRCMLGFRSVHDSACGLKVLHRESIMDIRLTKEWDRYLPDILFLQGFRLKEVFIHDRPRGTGQSHYGILKSIRALRDLLLLRWYAFFPDHAPWKKQS